MIDLAIITATLARDRVADQFAGPAVTDAAAAAPVRRAAVRGPRAIALVRRRVERAEPARRLGALR